MNPIHMKMNCSFAIGMVLAVLGGPKALALSPDEQMKQFADQSQKLRPACEKFKKESASLLGKESVDKGWKWDGKTESLIRLATNYPGTPAASQSGQKLLRSTTSPGRYFTVRHVAGLYGCEAMAYFNVSKKLIASLPKIPKDQQGLAVKALLNQARIELASPGPLLPVLIQGVIIQRLALSKILPSLTAQKDEIKKAAKKSVAIKRTVAAEALRATRATIVQAWAKESQLAKEAADDWLAILKRFSADGRFK